MRESLHQGEEQIRSIVGEQAIAQLTSLENLRGYRPRTTLTRLSQHKR